MRRLDLIGPTVDNDIRRAVSRYGAKAVREAVQRLVKLKRGQKGIPDWPEISEILKEDARLWLEGGDPFTARSEYSIAKEHSERYPGQSQESTHRRMMKKLAEHRIYYTLVHATYLSEEEFSYLIHHRALTELAKIEGHGDLWVRRLELAGSDLADYESKFGAPSKNLTMKEIELGARHAPPATPAVFNFLGELLRIQSR